MTIKPIVLRFIRAFIAGAVANMALVIPFSGSSWKEVGTWVAALSISGIVGGITGLIMALDKASRMK